MTFYQVFFPWLSRVEFSARKGDCLVTVSGDRITLSKRSDPRPLTVEPQRLSWRAPSVGGQFRMKNAHVLEVGAMLRDCLSN